jgi:thioredoxin-related protein
MGKMLFHIATTVLLMGSNGLAHGQTGPEWVSLEDGQNAASKDRKVLFVFFEADWCGICKRMKKEAFRDAEVLSLLESQFIAVSVDIDSKQTVFFNGKEYSERSFAQTMDVVATPTMTFADHDGKILGETSGYYDEARFLLLLRYLDSELFHDMTFEAYEARVE